MKTGYEIIYEDKEMLVCSKPAGMLAQSGKSFDVDLVSALMTYRRKKVKMPILQLLTGWTDQSAGLWYLRRTARVRQRLSKMLQQDTFNKQYYAVICGKPDQKTGTFVDYLLKDAKSNTSKVVNQEVKGAKRCELTYETIDEIFDEETGKNLSLVRIHLITGRHHQIRVQFAARNLALAGDGKYGGEEALKAKDRSIALCAYSLDIQDRHYEIKPEGEFFGRFVDLCIGNE